MPSLARIYSRSYRKQQEMIQTFKLQPELISEVNKIKNAYDITKSDIFRIGVYIVLRNSELLKDIYLEAMESGDTIENIFYRRLIQKLCKSNNL